MPEVHRPTPPPCTHAGPLKPWRRTRVQLIHRTHIVWGGSDARGQRQPGLTSSGALPTHISKQEGHIVTLGEMGLGMHPLEGRHLLISVSRAAYIILPATLCPCHLCVHAGVPTPRHGAAGASPRWTCAPGVSAPRTRCVFIINGRYRRLSWGQTSMAASRTCTRRSWPGRAGAPDAHSSVLRGGRIGQLLLDILSERMRCACGWQDGSNVHVRCGTVQRRPPHSVQSCTHHPCDRDAQAAWAQRRTAPEPAHTQTAVGSLQCQHRRT